MRSLTGIVLIGITIALQACQVGPKIPDENHIADIDTAGQKLTKPQEQFQLQPLQIDEHFIFPDGEHVRGEPVTPLLKEHIKPESFDEFYSDEDTYFIADTVAQNDTGVILLIVKYDVNETSGWLIIYNALEQVTDQIEVYYENAEGNFYLTTEIKDNHVITTGENIVPEPEPVTEYKQDGMQWVVIRGTRSTED